MLYARREAIMPKILSQVDRTTGNYEEAFIYTIHASFNGIEGEINSAKIEIFIPNYFTVYLGDMEKPIQEVTQVATEEGWIYTFDLGKIQDLGISLRFGLGLVFQTSVPSGTTYTMIPKLLINEEVLVIYESPVITLFATARFVLSRERILPLINPAPASTVYYKVSLTNFGDLGSTIKNIEIICNGNEDFIIDPSFPIIGKDVTSGNFSDTQSDGLVGLVENNQILFSIPIYSGQTYEFLYRGMIGEESFIGLEIDTTATWRIDDVSQKDDLDTLLLQEPTYDANISVYGPDYTLPKENILYQLNFQNSGNQILDNVTYTFNLPEDVVITKFSTGIFHISQIDELLNTGYEIFYTTKNEQEGSLGIFNSDTNSQVDLTLLLEEGDQLEQLTWSLETLGVGVKNKISPTFMGQVSTLATIGGTLLSSFQLEWNENGFTRERIGNQSAVVEDICVLMPFLSQSTNGVPVRPGEIFTYTLGANCISSRLYTPFFALLLPPELEYVGNETLLYNNSFEETISPKLPIPKVIPNFLTTGETLVAYSFTDDYTFNFSQKSFVFINLDVAVSVGAKGTFNLNTLLNTIESKSAIPNTIAIYEDKNNMADNISVNAFYAKSTVVTNQILFFVSTTSNKKVKGSLDTTYQEEPLIGNALGGDFIDYKITVTNIGNADLESIEIIDILPYQGDTGVIETTAQRGSQFSVYTGSEIIAQIFSNTEEVKRNQTFDVYYSQSKDPLRFSSDFGMIGSDDDWSQTPPEDITTVTAIKILTLDTKLLPNESLEIQVKSIVPIMTPTDSVAWNSFAADITYLDSQNTLSHLLAIEPEKVGIKINESPANTGNISGFVWLDDNLNGLYENKEDKVNDIGVVLYNQQGTPLKATFTTTTFDNQPGYYYFSNLKPDTYLLKFFIDDTLFKFTTTRLDATLGSSVNPTTSLTPFITLAPNETFTSYHAGIIPKDAYTIETILEINGSTRSMLKNVIYNQMLIGMKLEDLTELNDV